ncbi:membrane protein [Actinoallomurus acanthiterrae]
MTRTPADAFRESRTPRRRRLSPTARKVTVIVHLIASIGWLTLTLCVLVLGVGALTTSDADTLRAVYRAMPVLGDALILPLSVLSFGSGVVLAIGTAWGLFRYHWVAVKFWLTLAAILASNFALTDRLHEAADAVARHPTGSISSMDLGFLPYNLVIIPCVGLALYTTNAVLSVVKPWGLRAKATRASTPYRDRRRTTHHQAG